MKVILVQISPWDKVYYFDPKGHNVELEEKVIIKTDFGTEIGAIIGIRDFTEKEIEALNKAGEDVKPILRKANLSDLEKSQEKEEHRKEAMEVCKGIIKKHNLPMKVADVRFSFEGGRITFAFIAKGRIDFRELVKDLTHHFQKSIRLQQISVREEAKFYGKVGPCGRELCCVKFLKDLGNVTLEKAQDQQIVHWGPDRLSGVCGRLKCCLLYEEELYKALAAKMPAIGSSIKTNAGHGKVVGWHILKQTVDVRLDNDTVVEVPVEK